MTDPNVEHDTEVPLRLQPVVAHPEGWRGRSVNLIAVALVGFVVIGVVLGNAFDNGAPASSQAAIASVAPSPSASPTRRPRPTRTPLATPLPTLEASGTERPNERRLVMGNGVQILDVATGTLRSFGRQYEDLLWPVEDELVCICLVRWDEPAPALRFMRFDLTGKTLMESELLSLADAVAVPEMTEGFNFTAAFDAEHNRLVVVTVVRRPPSWVVELLLVDARTGDLLDREVIDEFAVELEEPRPSASPNPGSAPDGVYAWASMVALSADGATAFVTAAASTVRGEQWTNRHLEWLVPIVDDGIGGAAPLSPEAALDADRWCVGRAAFLGDELVAQLCGPPSRTPTSMAWSVRRLTRDGEALDELLIGPSQDDGRMVGSPVIDRARRSMLLWDSFAHTLSRVNLDDGIRSEGAVAESMLPGGRGPSGRGWFGVEPGIVASVDGTRLYALGLAAGPGDAGVSTGIWVFDAETLELLDHWEPRALLTSLAMSADGRFVYASGASGYDVDGNNNPRWPASLTVYDARTGEIVVLYGSLGEGQWLSFQVPA